MKVEELMIGDWVYNKHHKKNIKITPFDFFTHGHLPSGRQYFIGEPELVSGRDLEPIPFTPEILEKNGFRIIFDGELHVSYFQDIKSFHTEVKVDKIGIYQKLSMLDGLGNGVTIGECKYVHQFQHALRLCGIKKEITL